MKLDKKFLILLLNTGGPVQEIRALAGEVSAQPVPSLRLGVLGECPTRGY